MPTKRNAPSPPVQRECLHCGQEFTTHMAHIRLGGGKYCGRACFFAHRTRPLEERFWAKVDKSGNCWLWQGGRNRQGYGHIGGMMLAHRYSYFLAHGPIPAGVEVCHDCPGGDNPLCVNPAHLWLGTHAENMEDMVRKGRASTDHNPIGERHSNAVLTENQVRDIRARRANGERQIDLAAEYGVGETTIWNLVNRRTWKHVG